ncbi:MAG TPA: hypothetical protein VF077_13025 [Nitrospiraceae bacterium]
MSLDLTQLTNLKEKGNGWEARCPACAELGLDKRGNHLWIKPDGKYGCCVYAKDHAHRKRIWALAHGDKPMPVKRIVEKPKVPFDFDAAHADRNGRPLLELADALGLAASSLMALKCWWKPGSKAWAFPMVDEYRKEIGVRLRADSGFKFAVEGSTNGLFLSPYPLVERQAIVVEGPTNAAAGIQLGWFTIGLPAARVGWDYLAAVVRRLHIRELIIIADNKVRDDGKDDVGLLSAEEIGKRCGVAFAVLVLPCKDLRDFVACGGTGAMFEHEVKRAIWRR